MQSLIILSLLLTVCSSTHLPSTFQKCDRHKGDFNQCLPKAVENAISQLNHSIPSVGLINFEPLKIPFLSVAPGGGPAQFYQNYTNLRLSGVTKIQFWRFDVDFDKKVIAFDFTNPELVLNFTYDVGGHILAFPLTGHGPGLIILSNLLSNYSCHFEEYEKNGEKHYRVTRSDLLMQPSLIHYKLDNLFNGDERLVK
ncbi:hypothetical protein Zmor_017287 [Zophobas morio]|uniref:Uncharacterized protein n=1 Tax=Zophobas morio TaxID=2755281 RepID=A0AA38IB87_9CUCU|nr:hypothetical protein Zmor_017287 [Zophobas morio]